jgi:hypothetical protein
VWLRKGIAGPHGNLAGTPVTTNVAGIDPGLTGALAIIDEFRVMFVNDLPVHQIHAGKTTRASRP